MQSTQITREQFAHALRYGRGKALLQTKQFGLSNVADLVLTACLHNQTYDPQCEDDRAEWLLEMFAESPDYSRFVAEISTVIERKKSKHWDVSQLCSLAALLAKRGEQGVRQSLQKAALFQARKGDPWIGAHAFISVAGVTGIVALSRCYGKRLQNESEPPLLIDIVESDDQLKEALETLRMLSDKDRWIAAYCEFCENNTRDVENARKEAGKRSRREYRAKVRQELPLRKILADAADAKGIYPSQYMRFGLYATDCELKKVMRRLTVENDNAVILRLLWIFRRVRAPELSPRFFELASSPIRNIRLSAMKVLAQFKDPSVGEFARQILRKGKLESSESEVLELFVHNYELADTGLIVPILLKLNPGFDDAHWICMSVLEIYEENQPQDFAEALLWVYETTPCTSCRRDAVRALHELRKLPSEIMEESLFDASEQTRELVREIINKQLDDLPVVTMD